MKKDTFSISMKRILFLLTFFIGIFYNTSVAQSPDLSAVFDASKNVIRLNWNMVTKSVRTGFLLLKSTNGIEWTEVAKGRRLRNYSEDDLYTFTDKNITATKIFYRLKIFDVYNNTVALSPIVSVKNYNNTALAVNNSIKKETITTQNRNISKTEINNNNWILYPNPATDYLTLNYKGNTDLKGVVNIQVQDATGKVVVKFRSGSAYKTIQVPVSKLQRGIYFVQVTVLNNVMMNQKFVKQ